MQNYGVQCSNTDQRFTLTSNFSGTRAAPAPAAAASSGMEAERLTPAWAEHCKPNRKEGDQDSVSDRLGARVKQAGGRAGRCSRLHTINAHLSRRSLRALVQHLQPGSLRTALQAGRQASC